jgi:hypothetical protein
MFSRFLCTYSTFFKLVHKGKVLKESSSLDHYGVSSGGMQSLIYFQINIISSDFLVILPTIKPSEFSPPEATEKNVNVDLAKQSNKLQSTKPIEIPKTLKEDKEMPDVEPPKEFSLPTIDPIALQQFQDMGFNEARSRKALILNK